MLPTPPLINDKAVTKGFHIFKTKLAGEEPRKGEAHPSQQRARVLTAAFTGSVLQSAGLYKRRAK